MIRLTQRSNYSGWASKIGQDVLNKILNNFKYFKDRNVLVSGNTYDDAGVYRIKNNLAIVQTVDFFTPVVDDPYIFGKIAITNSLSDIYAMGAIPKTALNIVSFPVDDLDINILKSILKGGSDKLYEAGVNLLGGHSVKGYDLKYGAAVTGFVNSKKIWKNIGAKENDILILTKPLGTGFLIDAIKKGIANNNEVENVIYFMEKLNSLSSTIAKKYNVHACTDITGFGLIGHMIEMIKGENLSFIIYKDKIPLIQGAEKYSKLFKKNKNNSKFFDKKIKFNKNDFYKKILFNSETSGGLLFAFSENDSKKYIKEMESIGEKVFNIGKVIKYNNFKIIID